MSRHRFTKAQHQNRLTVTERLATSANANFRALLVDLLRSMSKDGKTDQDEAKHKARIKQILYQSIMAANTAGKNLAREMMQTIAAGRPRNGKKLDTEEERLAREAEHARKRSSRLVTRIYEGARNRIRSDLGDLMQSDEGFTLHQAIDYLGEIMNANTGEPLSGYDISRIVRTETHSVLVQSEHDNIESEAEELDLEMVKIWKSAKFSLRTRPTHAAADGQRRGMDEMFDVGDAQLRFPGDQMADAPGETINCRCICAYEPAPQRPTARKVRR